MLGTERKCTLSLGCMRHNLLNISNVNVSKSSPHSLELVQLYSPLTENFKELIIIGWLILNPAGPMILYQLLNDSQVIETSTPGYKNCSENARTIGFGMANKKHNYCSWQLKYWLWTLALVEFILYSSSIMLASQIYSPLLLLLTDIKFNVLI